MEEKGGGLSAYKSINGEREGERDIHFLTITGFSQCTCTDYQYLTLYFYYLWPFSVDSFYKLPFQIVYFRLQIKLFKIELRWREREKKSMRQRLCTEFK